MGYSFWNAAGRLEFAASTSAKRVKSRGKGRAPANGSAIRGMPGSEFEPRLFCCAKSVACGRVIEREWGNPQRFPPHTPPSLRYARVRTTKPVGNHKKNTPSDRMGYSFWNVPRAGWNSLPQPARSASNSEVKAGLLRMALPFVGCREASSSLVYFAAQSAKNKEKPSFGRFQSVKKACHCEPVRAAKQVPLGYRLAWQSVSKTHNSCTFPQIPS